VLVPAAAGDAPGKVALLVNRRNPTVSTASPAFVQAAEGAPGWEGEVWDESVRVPCLTLQDLIEQHGRPAFIKIDVEGLEDRVLAGLTTAVPALSFEFTTIARSIGERCLDRLEALGPYRFDYALGETQMLALGRWASAAELRAILASLPHEANSGDVYAVRS
jgi:Methyltransferase FkbM domain